MAAFLRNYLRGSSCRIYMENVKTQIQIAQNLRYYYPDIQITCRAAANNASDETENAYYKDRPKLIIEVLSPSTERRDRAEKFYHYQQLDSLEAYVLVAQDTRRIEIYRRNNNWAWELYTEETTQVHLQSVELELPLDVIYEDVVFTEHVML
ncbi:Uma2 family endonuclease [Candidatus Venteria ishoeyi]|uniref:Uma2 family endonuclease n=1 Tax=Candidatus Venteria ishoeyi TaxID=1899563 RepID=UPI0025A4D43B|nr:Uma2 family endonuclease [Candidatus Venteria ishoeyi]MDM8545747.1 Uma2 family endonuclease [Candidatus Venteria ishoeyi]